MPSILSRFKRSPSHSSSVSDEGDRRRRSSTVSSSVTRSSQDDPSTSPSTRSNSTPKSPAAGKAGSTFVEDFDDGPVSPSKRKADNNTPAHAKHNPPPLTVPGSGLGNALGTPKLVLTEEGSNSPHSFSSNPALDGSPVIPSPRQKNPLGLGLRGTGDPETDSRSTYDIEDSLETPTVNGSFNIPGPAKMSSGAVPATAPVDASRMSAQADPRLRSDSVTSNPTRRSRSGPLVSRFSKPSSPAPSSVVSLMPVDSRNSSLSGRGKTPKRSKKGRTRSTSSGMSGRSGSIAAALAKSGLHIATPTDTELLPSAQSTISANRRHSSNRSPFLVRGKDTTDDESYMRADGDDEASRLDIDYDEDDDEDDSGSDLDEHLPVTGFAVASNRRQADFHALFAAVDEGDYLIEDYGCALSKDILVQGRLYVSENHLCFHANIFGWVTDVVLPFTEIRKIEKKMTALVIPNAIGVSTKDAKYTFASLISRDSTYDVMMNIWRLCNPDAVMSTSSFQASSSRPPSIAGEEPHSPGVGGGGGGGGAVHGQEAGGKPDKGHAKTQCSCIKDGKHYSETALDTVFNSQPEKVYNLMFNSEWFKTFMSENQKLKDIETSDWRPSPENKHLTRTISYIKPLNGSIGPKQTKCHIADEQEHCDFDQYISMLTTTRTPDVPSGGVFSVKTRTCLTWAGANSTRVLVTTTVEWTGKSWVKGIIEKSAIDGQKSWHDDLATGMRAYMKEHSTEFAGAAGEADEDEDATAAEEGKKDSQPTEAAAYAAQQRKERQELDFWSMQGGFDSVVSGLRSILSGLKAVFDSLRDILSDLPVGREVIFGTVIALLLISNVYTFFAFRSVENSEIRRAKKMGHRSGLSDDDVAEAMKLILRQRVKVGAPMEEARELERVLDDVKVRVDQLRSAIETAVSEGKKGGLNDMD